MGPMGSLCVPSICSTDILCTLETVNLDIATEFFFAYKTRDFLTVELQCKSCTVPMKLIK
jgi:hypothetical protein